MATVRAAWYAAACRGRATPRTRRKPSGHAARYAQAGCPRRAHAAAETNRTARGSATETAWRTPGQPQGGRPKSNSSGVTPHRVEMYEAEGATTAEACFNLFMSLTPRALSSVADGLVRLNACDPATSLPYAATATIFATATTILSITTITTISVVVAAKPPAT